MATGDDALAAGMDIMTGSEQANTLDTEMNLTRDYIAQRTSAVTPISKGGTGATSASAARTNLGVAAAGHTHAWGDITGKPSSFPPSSHEHERIYKNGHQLYLTENGTMSHYVGSTRIFGWSSEGVLNAGSVPATMLTGTVDRPVSTSGSGRFGAAWNNNITSDRRAVWMESNGTLGHTASSARYKKNITPWAALTEDEQFAQLQVVTFKWRASHANPDDPDHVEVGMIAESLHDLGLTFAVFYEPDSFGVLRPEGIHYDRLALLIIPYVQRLGARVAAIETRLAALEAK